jgi:hypothetical protein
MRSSSLPIGLPERAATDFMWRGMETCCGTDNRRATNPRQSKHGSFVAKSPRARHQFPPARQPFLPAALCVWPVFGMPAQGVKRDRLKVAKSSDPLLKVSDLSYVDSGPTWEPFIAGGASVRRSRKPSDRHSARSVESGPDRPAGSRPNRRSTRRRSCCWR